MQNNAKITEITQKKKEKKENVLFSVTFALFCFTFELYCVTFALFCVLLLRLVCIILRFLLFCVAIDLPRHIPSHFRNAIGLCHFSDWPFWKDGGLTRPPPRPMARPLSLPQCHRTWPLFEIPSYFPDHHSFSNCHFFPTAISRERFVGETRHVSYLWVSNSPTSCANTEPPMPTWSLDRNVPMKLSNAIHTLHH